MVHTLAETKPTLSQAELVTLPLADIFPSPTNPRKHFEPKALEDLAENIKQHGVLAPILVRPNPPKWQAVGPDLIDKGWRLESLCGESTRPMPDEKTARAEEKSLNNLPYELVAGERRFRASTLAGKKTVPALVRELNDLQVLEIQYIENLQRQDLNAMEEGEGFQKLIATGNYTADSLAEKLNKSRSHIFSRMRMARLHGPVREAFLKEAIPSTVAALIAQIPDYERQVQALNEILKPRYTNEPMSFRSAKEHIEENYMVCLKGSIFDQADDAMPGGKCAKCPKRSGNMKDQFPDIGRADICTDINCYGHKREIAWTFKTEEARQQGRTVLTEKQYEEVRYDSKYIDLDEKNYSDPKSRTWRELLKKEKPGTILAMNENKIVELLPKAIALSLAGIKIGRAGASEDEKAARAKAKLETAVQEAVVRAVVQAVEDAPDESGFLELVTGAVCASIWSDSIRPIIKGRGFQDQDELAAAIKKMDDQQLRGLLVEMVVCRGLRGAYLVQDHAKAVLDMYCIDRNAIAKRVEKEMKSGQKPKKELIVEVTIEKPAKAKGKK